jgi:undecaprenyl diphosphate synthase
VPVRADVEDLEKNVSLPTHVAIIMDGNGRWAEERKRPRLFGHKAGVDSVREIIETARSLGIRYLTLYAFSTENWNRPANEVSGLMGLLQRYLQSELKIMLENDIRLRCLGEPDRLPVEVRTTLMQTIHDTRACSGMTLNLALNYGGRSELIRAMQVMAKECCLGDLACEDITETTISDRLFTTGQPDPDLLIRTGGERRLSNFLLWQLSYAELYFTDVKWPDFRKEQFFRALETYQSRQRRFGRIAVQLLAE